MKKIVLYLLTITVINLSALTQAVRQAPAAARRGAQAVTTKAGTALERAAVIRPAVARPSTIRQTPVRYRSTVPPVAAREFNKAYAGVLRHKTSKFLQNPKTIALAIGATSIAVGIAVREEAEKLADLAIKHFNMAMFDESLISDEFSRAIVRIYQQNDTREKVDMRSSAFIVHVEKEPDLYFVITAAHCIYENGVTPIIAILSNLQDPSSVKYVPTIPLVVDKDNDIAVLLIPQVVIKEMSLSDIPAIPVSQLANFKPYKNEGVTLQGYPGFLSPTEPGFYRQKFTSEGPAIWPIIASSSPDKPLFVNLAGEELVPSLFDEERVISGASGSPVIGLHNKEPYVVGVHSAGLFNSKMEPSSQKILVSGPGQLPEYLAKAKEFYPEKEEVIRKAVKEQQKAQEEVKPTQAKTTWLGYLKSFFW